jgi:hypothetical protein
MNEVVVALIGGLSLVIVAMIQTGRKTGKARWEENKADHNFVVEKIDQLGKSLGRSVDRIEKTAERTEVKLDTHINDHLTGKLD